MLFTCIKDNYSNALPLFIWSSCFAPRWEEGGGWWGWDGQEKSDFFFFFWLSSLHLGCSLFGKKNKKQKKTKKEPTFMSTVYLCFGLARSVWGLPFRKEGWERWRCKRESAGRGRWSFRNVPTCQRWSGVGVGGPKCYDAGHRCFINTWKWLLRRALNYKCNSLSAIAPQEEGMEEEGKSNFKL